MTSPPAKRDPAPRPPDRIAVDHILIGVRGPGFPQGRRVAGEAEVLALGLLAKLRAGTDWDTTKREYSEDPPPGGPYRLSNHGVPPSGRGEYARGSMVPAFGDVGFGLAVGEIGLAPFDPRTSPFGFHLIKRMS
jgi:parvulin-like peptidyl-prolyl isomerase